MITQKKKKLYLVRDRFGVKPLCYFENEDFFICATEAKPINIINNKNNLNFHKIKEYLDFGLIHQDEYTLIKGIKKVKPATYLVYDLKKLKFIFSEKKILAFKKGKKINTKNC